MEDAVHAAAAVAILILVMDSKDERAGLMRCGIVKVSTFVRPCGVIYALFAERPVVPQATVHRPICSGFRHVSDKLNGKLRRIGCGTKIMSSTTLNVN